MMTRRLFLLIGLLAAAGGLYLALHGLPWSSGDEDLSAAIEEPDDGGTAPTAGTGNPDGETTNTGTSRGPYTSNHSGSSGDSTGRANPPAKMTYAKVARIARRPKPDHLQDLKAAATSKDERTREAAALGLGRLGKSSDPQTLVAALRTDKAAAVRAAAATALGRLRCWDAGPSLIDALDDPDATVRSRAGAALRKIMGVDFRYRANGANRQQIIQKIRAWWPEFYQGHLGRIPRRGSN